MGTNFYAYKKLKKAQKDKILQSLENDEYDSVVFDINQMVNKVHIGKQSFGWKFLFNPNSFKYYEPTMKSIDIFLRGEDILLEDEYGRKIDVGEFWNIVERSKDKIGNKEYNQKYPDEMMFLYGSKCDEIYQQYNPSYFEFYNDGLRFSISSEFS